MKKIFTLILFFSVISFSYGQIILNEICYDPSNNELDGDTNGDGAYSQAEDEFLEFVNTGTEAVDMSGYKIYDTEALDAGIPSHTFPEGSIVIAGGAIVVFGGGTPTGEFGGAVVQTSTSGDMNMNNSGDIMSLFDADDNLVLDFDIEPLSNNPNESYTRNPDITGEFEQHSDNTDLLFSPGTKIDGTPFATIVLVESVDVSGEGGANSIETPGGTLQMIATITPEDASDPSVTWSLDPETGVASIDENGLLTALENGTVTVTATANDGSGASGFAVIEILNQDFGLANNERISFEVYPNPVVDEFVVKSDRRVLEASIYNLTGQMVKLIKAGTKFIDVSDLNEGVYIISIKTELGRSTSRFVKTK